MAPTKRQPRRPRLSANGGWTALTPERQAKIVENIKKGVHVKVAARAAGIDEHTLNRWQRQGEDKIETDPDTGAQTITKAPEPYRSFRTAIAEAEAELELAAVQVAYTGSIALPFGNTAGVYTFLARRFRERWTPKDTIELSGPEGAPIEVKVDDTERLAGILGALERAGVVALPSPPEGDAAGASAEDDAVHHPSADAGSDGVPPTGAA